jgi:hypothetical protein
MVHQPLNFTISRSSPWFQWVVLGSSALLCLTASIAYWFQPDSWAALLLCPRWLWLVFGLALALLGWTRRRKMAASAAAILWVAYAVVFVEEVTSLARLQQWPLPEWEAGRESGTAIRVVSLNCSGGDEDAAVEVSKFKPDVVLFQESPVRTKLRDMAQNLVGPEAEALCGPDVSIVVRGRITPVPLPRPWDIPFAHARVELASGLSMEVIVVRLQPYDVRADFWSSDCRRKQYAVRQHQRRQIEWLSQQMRSIPPDVPLIVGGDFNQPGRDLSLRLLRPRLRDAYCEGGSGWGNTLDNDIPFLRIDQVWHSQHFRAASVVARRTVHSDHRMVVCDLICAPGRN